ncbi:MAG: 6-bladed beta-propeller [Candidatus Saccharicenans sp.]|nr:MAG: hypothetical protein C0168_06735 [Candidatus Aminicenantes bacterium]
MQKKKLMFFVFIYLYLFSIFLFAYEISAVSIKTGLLNQSDKFNKLFELHKKIILLPRKDYNISTVPKLVAINKHDDFIVLDNFINRQILVFDKDGRQKAEIGKRGKKPGEYMFPDCLYYNEYLDKYYVYDGDLLKIAIYDGNFKFDREFNIPLFLESLVVTDKERFFCYTSGAATKKGPDKVIYECDKDGRIINKFCEMSKNYNPLIETKALGVILENNFLFVTTPYEYVIKKYELDGKLVRQAKGNSKNYVSPSILTKDEMNRLRNDFFSRKSIHDTFSHIFYLLKLSDNLIGVLYTSANRKSAFLDLYDLNLNLIESDIDFPMRADGAILVFSKGDFLYRVESDNSLNQSLFIYVYKYNREKIKKINY